MAEAFRVATEIYAVMRDPKPVSVNKLYASTRNGRFLTKEGTHFKDTLAKTVSESTLRSSLPWKEAVDLVYLWGGFCELEVALHLEELRNPAWSIGGSIVPKSKAARLPYKKLDITNFVKLIEDAVAVGTGIDDSANMTVVARKYEDKKDPRVEIRYVVFG